MSVRGLELVIAERDAQGLRLQRLDGTVLGNPAGPEEERTAVAGRADVGGRPGAGARGLRVCMAGPDVDAFVLPADPEQRRQDQHYVREAAFPGVSSVVSRPRSAGITQGGAGPRRLRRAGGRSGRDSAVQLVVARSVLAEYLALEPQAVLLGPVSLLVSCATQPALAGILRGPRAAALVLAQTWFTLIALRQDELVDARSDRRPEDPEDLRRHVEFYLGRMFSSASREIPMAAITAAPRVRESAADALPSAQLVSLRDLVAELAVTSADFADPARRRRRRRAVGLSAGVVPAVGAALLSQVGAPVQSAPGIPARSAVQLVPPAAVMSPRPALSRQGRTSGAVATPTGTEEQKEEQKERETEAAGPSGTSRAADASGSAAGPHTAGGTHAAAETAAGPTGEEAPSEAAYPYDRPAAPEGRYAFAGTGRSVSGERVWYFIDRSSRRVVSVATGAMSAQGAGNPPSGAAPSGDPPE